MKLGVRICFLDWGIEMLARFDGHRGMTYSVTHPYAGTVNFEFSVEA